MPVNSFEDYPMSWRPTLNDKVKPLYLSLAHQLEQDIKAGHLLPGTKLPPQRELADFLDINVSTVSKACKVCELKGLLSATVGSGTFVSFDALANAYLLPDDKPRNLIELGAVFPDTATFEPLIGCLKEMLNEADADKLFNYSRPNADIWLKDTAVKLMEKGGFSPGSASILFSNGGQNAITAILAGLCRHGDKIGADPHTYSGLKTTASMLGIQLTPIRHRDGEMDDEALLDACRNENIKGIYLITTPPPIPSLLSGAGLWPKLPATRISLSSKTVPTICLVKMPSQRWPLLLQTIPSILPVCQKLWLLAYAWPICQCLRLIESRFRKPCII